MAGVDQTIFDKTLVRATYFENYLRDFKYNEKWVEAGINYDVAKTGGKARIRGIEVFFAVDNLFDKDYYQGWRASEREFFGEVVYKL